ncbi:hypothetical protein ACIRPU_30040 [Streptomyces sp. NPDC102259]|uniref:hypothetical protein n=1 Tax=Streptomyces sp. NPDC102259 TaxID=3366148 RepID=UPI0038271D15
MIALVGLIFTGAATYYQAAVTNDQLDQSREGDQYAKRSQAMRVFYWVEEPADGHLRLHLVNSSPDPVSDADVHFGAPVGLMTAVYSDLYVSYEQRIPYLPPCSDTILDSRHWLYMDEGQFDKVYRETHLLPGWEKLLKPLPTPDAVWVGGLTFSDRDGVWWQRTSTALEQAEVAGPSTEGQADHYGWGYIRGTPELKATASCSGDQAS